MTIAAVELNVLNRLLETTSLTIEQGSTQETTEPAPVSAAIKA